MQLNVAGLPFHRAGQLPQAVGIEPVAGVARERRRYHALPLVVHDLSQVVPALATLGEGTLIAGSLDGLTKSNNLVALRHQDLVTREV